jgi:serine/threonine-protein kinase
MATGKDEATGRHYLVMEYVDGLSAQALLDQHGKLSVADGVHIALDIAHALEHAQARSIVHRDIKPENILITRSGIAKLADLGLAKQMNDQATHLTATRQGFGTPYYMPYEQAINAKEADGRSDIYGLGATLYHLVTGKVPFDGETQIEILEKKDQGVYTPASLLNPKIPDELNRILDRMLARQPADRYQTASELIVDLERSGLSAPVMSFIDRDVAMQDPVVRARVARAGQTTQPDIQRTTDGRATPRTWVLRYREKGTLRQARATTSEVLVRIQQGRIDGAMEAAYSSSGQFRKLSAYPEFRQALQIRLRHTPQPSNATPSDTGATEPPTQYGGWWYLAVGVAAAALLVGGMLCILVS